MELSSGVGYDKDMRHQFVAHRFSAQSEALVTTCDQIISEYQGMGFRLTLRQLYYQLVSRNVIPNVERTYKNLSGLVSDARLAGRLDWDAIEDRIRVPVFPPEWNNLEELVEAALRAFRLPRWKGQEHYVELWVEKDALAGVLRPLAMEHHVTLLVNRGYSSQSAMYDAYERFAQKVDEGKTCILFYLGDFDPSGEDMVRDIGDRLTAVFGVTLTVEKLALTMEQVRQYNPPPNPAKRTDPRSRDFIRRHGVSSWEVDALPPDVLNAIIREAFAGVIDVEAMKKVLDREARDKVHLGKALEHVRSELQDQDEG